MNPPREKTYEEMVADMRRSRNERMTNERRIQIRTEWEDLQQQRAEAEAQLDQSRWDELDSEMEALEREDRDYTPQPTVQQQRQQAWNNLGGAKQEFLMKQRGYLGRTGGFFGENAKGMQLFAQAHELALRAGCREDSADYFEHVRRNMEMNAEKVDPRLAFDRSEEMITEQEAAKLSGLSLDQYRRNQQTMVSQGRMSWQQKK